MSTKLARRWAYALLLSIIVLVTAFLGFGVRAFASAVLSHSIFLAALGVVLLVVPMYFALRRPRTPGPADRMPPHVAAAALAKLKRKSPSVDVS
jgi:uncharacterized membrane protein YtjA (UPF0391 family)